MVLNPSTSHAQSILERAKQKMKQRADAKVDKAMNDGLDKAEGKKTKEKVEKNGDVKIKDDEGKVKIKEDKADMTSANELTYTSKYDFVPGDKVIAFEDFNSAAIGDFPTRWNTNATAEVVTINNKEGKWLKIGKEGTFYPEFISNLPENFTLEFDLGVNNDWNSNGLNLNIANIKKPEDFGDYGYYVRWQGVHAVHLAFRPGVLASRSAGTSQVQAGKDGNHTINNNVDFNVWDNRNSNFAHLSVWRQNQRLRVYLNGEKIWDLPRAFDASGKYNAITFAYQGSYKTEDYFLLGNVRLAAGAPDTRNKLITEGKFVTSGINFDVNSDKIKPESYGIIKEIANVLKENETVKVKIVGHTDSDGDDSKNMELSKKRAESVKNALANDFQISSGRLEIDGKGESVSVGKNDTPEGKAQNRRVEFIKM
jgi:outer membrane protein OmpA-like peptidoglycan-associated protein